MLTQFRKRYPHASLISELVQIDRDKYIVRALVQVGGMTIATGLAAADTVEQAEDRARSRALAILEIDEAIVVPSEVTVTKTPKVESVKTREPQTAVSQPLEKIDRAEISPSQSSATNRLRTISDSLAVAQRDIRAAQRNSGDNLEEDALRLSGRDCTPASVQAQDKVESPESLPLLSNGATSPQTTGAFAKSEGSQENVSFRESMTSDLEEARLSFQETATETAELGEVVSGSPQLPLETATPSPTLSFDEMMLQTTVQMKRLGWTDKQGREYLIEAYGKRSRHLLNDEELLDFLRYLESLPS
ncbi:MAG: hypothetical protein IGR93_19585 [Hydrococcus sp. C42_A2020_068]|uniref:hypothetical protein n=1 Tax=Pleurocapsa sp. PCC 7327 TaxID=118163 RepID=UPI00029F8161|nr:hypothetical protein [Pleurocapsa sp. PCC 7327]AFY77474.1 hypothetical protein Ple7327_2151 [Pleurocapsa sp. PCC 7327]MBF2022230.1 hypothetical protein [Hydrococcus sp. C42_A2020_068]